MTLQSRQKTIRLFKWLGIALATALISMGISLALKDPPSFIGITLAAIFVASLVISFFLFLLAFESLAKAKGYNPIIIIIPFLVLFLPDISNKSGGGR